MAELPTILYEDNHLLVVAKPSMIPTMGAAAGTVSLVDQLKEYLREKYQKPGNVYVGVVSRLDAWVSGVIVFARTSKAAERLNQQFRQRNCRKTYLAIIPEDPNFPPIGQLQHWIIKNESRHKMEVVSGVRSRSEVQLASLAYRTIAIQGGQRLLEIELETGRKHQIRVQLSALGCPIIGDQKYGSDVRFPRGIALHSHRLELEHPTQKNRMSFTALPPDYWPLKRFGFAS